MKKIISVLISMLLIFSAFNFIACGSSNDGGAGNESDKCVRCLRFGDETVYKQNENEMEVYVGKACNKCGYVSNPEKTFTIDYVVDASNELTMAQNDAEQKELDCTILVKAGEYDKLYVIGRYNGSTHIIFETGAKLSLIDIQNETYDVTIENANFEFDPSNTASGGIHFEGGGNSSENLELSYSNITIKNCRFYGHSTIHRAWQIGMVYDLVIEDCVFENVIKGASTSRVTPIFLPEVWGLTIRNNTFKSADYGAIYVGATGNEVSSRGSFDEIIIENNYFEDIQRSYCVCVLNINEAMVTIKDNTFNDLDTIGVRFTVKSGSGDYVAEVLENTWAKVPDYISNSTYYDPRDQIIK